MLQNGVNLSDLICLLDPLMSSVKGRGKIIQNTVGDMKEITRKTGYKIIS